MLGVKIYVNTGTLYIRIIILRKDTNFSLEVLVDYTLWLESAKSLIHVQVGEFLSLSCFSYEPSYVEQMTLKFAK